jgi:hydroxypyruvate reductase
VTTAAHDLKQLAREIFSAALADADAARALRAAIRLHSTKLTIFDTELDLRAYTRVYAVAVGKAAHTLATALGDTLGARLTRGLVSAPPPAAPWSPAALSSPVAPPTVAALPAVWQVFAGGHPLPNEASLAAGRAARSLLADADAPDALCLFLISGGGSAMLEWPRDERVTLADLRAANHALVTCGATIAEINAVRRALSAVKGGGLSALAPRAAQVSLIVSDTNSGAFADVASGPTCPPAAVQPDALAHILERYQLRTRLPPVVVNALDAASEVLDVAARKPPPAAPPHAPLAVNVQTHAAALRRHYVLLDNESAKQAAARAARARGFAVEVCDDLIETPVDEGCRELVARVLRLRRAQLTKSGVCLISGGEFVCPVRGAGVGGRNLEATLRCAAVFDEHDAELARAGWHVAALHAGTDGVDGNSPAAGAVADETTVRRARALGLDAADFLARSDAYNFFRPLGDTIETGPTGTNVRDLRILLAS